MHEEDDQYPRTLGYLDEIYGPTSVAHAALSSSVPWSLKCVCFLIVALFGGEWLVQEKKCDEWMDGCWMVDVN